MKTLFFSGRKKPVLVILIKNQRASIVPSQNGLHHGVNTAHMEKSHIQSQPGGKADNRVKVPISKYVSSWRGSISSTLSTKNQRDHISNLKEATQRPANQQIK